jgi:crotonobetainyl-CoA:carnitine CoA-transferase CaiB-like acyl-CoA transferase
VPSAPVREIPEIVNDEHMHQRGALEWIDHPQFGRIVVQRGPMRYHGSPQTELRASAELGQHNAEVYGELVGLGDDDVQALIDAEVL